MPCPAAGATCSPLQTRVAARFPGEPGDHRGGRAAADRTDHRRDRPAGPTQRPVRGRALVRGSGPARCWRQRGWTIPARIRAGTDIETAEYADGSMVTMPTRALEFGFPLRTRSVGVHVK